MNYTDALILFVGGLIVGALVTGWLLMGSCFLMLEKSKRLSIKAAAQAKDAREMYAKTATLLNENTAKLLNTNRS